MTADANTGESRLFVKRGGTGTPTLLLLHGLGHSLGAAAAPVVLAAGEHDPMSPAEHLAGGCR